MIIAIRGNILRCVAETREKFGKNLLTTILRGNETGSIRDYALTKVPSFGALRNESRTQIAYCFDSLLKNGCLKRTSGVYPTLYLSHMGKRMLGSAPVNPVKLPKRLELLEGETVDRALMERVRNFRRKQAKYLNIPSFSLFSDAVLKRLVQTCPTTEDQLMNVLDAVVFVHQDWGDRENRYWARVKYVVKKKGIEWYRDQVSARLGFPLQKPNPKHNYGDRQLHLGWHEQPTNGLLTYGAYIENGRITDGSPNGKLKTMVREIMKKYDIELMVTPNQDLLFINIPKESKEEFEADLKSYGHGKLHGKPYSKLRCT